MAAVTGGTPASHPCAGGLRLSPRAPQQHKFGLFEIGPEHQFHLLTCRLRTGLRAATQAAIDHPPADTPCDSDFVAVLRQPHEGFELLTYAGPAFARLRRALGLPEELYQAALSSRYFQFVSNSKSKARFFLTQDKRFFLKTQTKQEMRLLLANLPRYLRHLEAFPRSLLVRLLGAHSIVVPRRSRAGAPAAALPCPQRYFTVTLSVFFPDEGILERYDIKGCSVDRWAEPASAVVLKDLNFEGKSLVLGSQRPWLLRQLELDSRFLEELRVLDYSLLLAVRPPLPDGLTAWSPVPCHVLQGSGLSQNLPGGSNPLHCIDGPQRRYSVGLVDLFSSYTFRRRLEHLWKRIRYRDGSFSTVPPAAYARRLCRWVEAHSE
ncbi:phosphatidylinositol 4-phosphate 5-kinase-like protein 1 [Anas acuta]|uniref:phosphatidylinositol 4-phosphate 5-kinase-like protein 1 n=1 Tax=Anas acuta TaxID=28680 RepID=UPI0035C93A43